MLVGGCIAFIMVTSVFIVTLDYIFAPNTSLKYNGFPIRVINQQFLVNVQGKDYTFSVYPSDLEYIEVPLHAKELLNAEVLTVTYDPQSDQPESLGEAQFYLEDQLKEVRIIDRAVLNNTGLALEQKSCANATLGQPVIELREGNESRIAVENECIIVTAIDNPDLARLTERVVYQVLGVMK